ncbi:MAG: response regulator [Planctomycetota bacterium]
MKDNTILVIDDSATIRRLCDNELSSAGYHVLLAGTAEDGVAMAQAEIPSLIILDHQLPGTTGYEVACSLLEQEQTAKIPVVASSTLRKKAYAEYVDCDNVVDMLPKPYTADALIATVENAINTAEMVVQSQCEGSAVPEVIDELGDADLAGNFQCFSVREVLDMLNNGTKIGTLEVESERVRTIIHVSEGRIQAVTATGIDPDTVGSQLPEALSELAPVVKFTVAGRRGSEVDGLVELLNNKVLDPRLLGKLLRLQAAILLRSCFRSNLKSFRFIQNQPLPPLFQKLPLNASLLGTLVEGALICDESELPGLGEQIGFSRKSVRGQNLDRAGLSSRHMKVLSIIAEPTTPQQLADHLDWSIEEACRVLHGFEMADLVERCQVSDVLKILAVVATPTLGRTIDTCLRGNQEFAKGRIVRDVLALRMLLRRARPDVILMDLSDETNTVFLEENEDALEGIQIIGFHEDPTESFTGIEQVLANECEAGEIAELLGLPNQDFPSTPLSTSHHQAAADATTGTGF